MTMLDYEELFHTLPGCYLVLTPELTIAGATDAYLRMTMTRREEIVGRPLFEVFPDNDPKGTGEMSLNASLQRVLSTRKPHTMAVLKYDIRRPESEGGDFEVRHWLPVNIPVLSGSGQVVAILNSVEDVTDGIRSRERVLELSTPVVNVRDRVLLLPLVGAVDSLRAERMTNIVLDRVVEQAARILILDISGVPVVDTDVAARLVQTAMAVRLLGARTILTGISGSTAKTMVHLGIDVTAFHTCGRLTDAIDLAQRLLESESDGAAPSPPA